MKITIEEFAEIVVGILVVILILFVLNKFILPTLQSPELIKHIFDALIGSGASSGGV